MGRWAQICLSDDDSKFLVRNKDAVHELHMKPKEIWFVNTGWNHTVEADADNIRRVGILGFHYDDLNSTLQQDMGV